ncbi:MAG: response regulator [Chloroflexi bacterium]|nr:response regulator [Chloroflexota bacterium]
MKRRVVVVDEEKGIVRLCQRLLERAGFEVIPFTQSFEALEYLQQHTVDVLLVDAQTPEMDGFVLMERARAHQPSLAVVVMSGYAMVEMAVEALYRGADGLVLKPFGSGELVESIWRALANRRRQERIARLAALRPLFDVAEALLGETRLEPLKALIVRKVAEVLPSGVVGLYAWDGQEGQLLASQGDAPPPDSPLLQQALESDAAWMLSTDTPGKEDAKHLLHAQRWHSVLVSPVTREARRYAVLVARYHPPSFREADAAALGILARLGAAALENARLYEDLRESLAQLERSQRALAHAEKMAAVGRLTASMAHEVNNPLQAVRNSLYLASHPGVDDDRRGKYLAAAQEEVERLVVLVRRMLDFYRPGNVELQLTELKPLVNRVLALMEEQLSRQGITVETDLPDDLPPVPAVEDQLQQVLLNLIINAMEAMPDGGKLYVLAWAEDDHVVLAVEDTGPGIPPHMREQIFEPLVSTKPQGTGLGLTVSYGIISAHGGQFIVAEPRRGSGAAFHIVLPREHRSQHQQEQSKGRLP